MACENTAFAASNRSRSTLCVSNIAIYSNTPPSGGQVDVAVAPFTSHGVWQRCGLRLLPLLLPLPVDGMTANTRLRNSSVRLGNGKRALRGSRAGEGFRFSLQRVLMLKERLRQH